MTPALARADERRNSPRVFLFGGTAILLVLLWLLFGDVLLYLADDWWNVPAYSHGMLLPPFALYLAWLSRNRVLAHPAVTDYRGLALSALACVLYLTGTAASEFFLTRISFVILLAGFVWTFWGWLRLRELLFPLLLLATMVPLPAILYNSVATPLQLLASNVAYGIASAAGVSIYRDGNILHLAGGALGVAEACSGLNSLSSLMVGSLLIGFLTCRSPKARLLVFCLSVPVAVLINVLRVAGTAILADYEYGLAMGFYHSLEGWLVFVSGAGALYLLALGVNRLIPGRDGVAQ